MIDKLNLNLNSICKNFDNFDTGKFCNFNDNVAKLPVLQSTDHNNAISNRDPRLFVPLMIRDHKIWALIDSGSTRTYFGKDMIPRLSDALLPCNATVIVANNAVETVSGEAQIQFTMGSRRRELSVRTVPSLSYDCILGIDFLRSFEISIDFANNTWKCPESAFVLCNKGSNILRADVVGEKCAGLVEISESEREQVDKIVKELIREPGRKLAATNLTEMIIELEDTTPIRQNPRRYSPKILSEAHKAVDKLLEEDIIEPCDSPWCSPPVLSLNRMVPIAFVSIIVF